MIPPFIGITGARQSGKTTLANLLVRYLNYHHDSFAAPMRPFIADLLGMSTEELEKYKEEPLLWLGGLTPRYLLQTLGTEWGRNTDPNIWVKSALQRVADKASQGIPIVFSDVRFPNEAQLIRENKGIIICVHRREELPRGFHQSEVPIRQEFIDLDVYNSRAPMDMLLTVQRFLLHASPRCESCED